MMYTITPARMQELERESMARRGMPSLLLMEHAALAVVRALEGLVAPGAQVLFVCGPGNNGGDGCAAARLWAQRGGRAEAWLMVAPEHMRGDAGVQARLLAHWDVPVRVITGDAPPPSPQTGAIVDALFGTGLARPLEGTASALVRRVNAAGVPVVAVDMPSGIDGNDGRLLGDAVMATETVTFHRPKPGHFLFPGRIHTGRLRVADIGLRAAWDDEPGLRVLEHADAMALLPPRPPDGHKGTFGHALIVAGSRGMAGAAALCAEAALRAGAGLVSVACPASILPTVQQLVPCAVGLAMPERDGRLCAEAAPLLRDAARGKQCVAMGPGLTASADVAAALEPLWMLPLPRIIDADALNMLALRDVLPMLGAQVLLTPHPGEMGRLLRTSATEAAENAIEATRALRQKTGAVALLKGATTIIDGEAGTTLNRTGTQGMATGGSGDVLTGILAGLCAQGMTPYEAASVGAYLHGYAGELCAQRMPSQAMLASDVLAAWPDALKPEPFCTA